MGNTLCCSANQHEIMGGAPFHPDANRTRHTDIDYPGMIETPRASLRGDADSSRPPLYLSRKVQKERYLLKNQHSALNSLGEQRGGNSFLLGCGCGVSCSQRDLHLEGSRESRAVKMAREQIEMEDVDILIYDGRE